MQCHLNSSLTDCEDPVVDEVQRVADLSIDDFGEVDEVDEVWVGN